MCNLFIIPLYFFQMRSFWMVPHSIDLSRKQLSEVHCSMKSIWVLIYGSRVRCFAWWLQGQISNVSNLPLLTNFVRWLHLGPTSELLPSTLIFLKRKHVEMSIYFWILNKNELVKERVEIYGDWWTLSIKFPSVGKFDPLHAVIALTADERSSNTPLSN